MICLFSIGNLPLFIWNSCFSQVLQLVMNINKLNSILDVLLYTRIGKFNVSIINLN